MIQYDSYSDGYAVGWENGNKDGYDKGYMDAVELYEERISSLRVDLHLLTARIGFLEKHTGLIKEE